MDLHARPLRSLLFLLFLSVAPSSARGENCLDWLSTPIAAKIRSTRTALPEGIEPGWVDGAVRAAIDRIFETKYKHLGKTTPENVANTIRDVDVHYVGESQWETMPQRQVFAVEILSSAPDERHLFEVDIGGRGASVALLKQAGGADVAKPLHVGKNKPAVDMMKLVEDFGNGARLTLTLRKRLHEVMPPNAGSRRSFVLELIRDEPEFGLTLAREMNFDASPEAFTEELLARLRSGSGGGYSVAGPTSRKRFAELVKLYRDGVSRSFQSEAYKAALKEAKATADSLDGVDLDDPAVRERVATAIADLFGLSGHYRVRAVERLFPENPNPILHQGSARFAARKIVGAMVEESDSLTETKKRLKAFFAVLTDYHFGFLEGG